MTGRADFFEEGGWNTVCFQCGRKRKASMMKRHWQGYYVCPEHWEPRQPQDFVRSVPDVQTPPWVQPMPADVFLPWNQTVYPADVVTVMEGDLYGYLLTYADYFAEDYMYPFLPGVLIEVTYVRAFADGVPVADALAVDWARPLDDSVPVADVLVVDRSLSLADSIVSSDSGSVQLQDYVDVTYFTPGDYVGSVSATF